MVSKETSFISQLVLRVFLIELDLKKNAPQKEEAFATAQYRNTSWTDTIIGDRKRIEEIIGNS